MSIKELKEDASYLEELGESSPPVQFSKAEEKKIFAESTSD